MKRDYKKTDLIVFLIIWALFVGKLIYLYFLKLSLSYDEAYYWEWSRDLALGYYSKPPMVAYLIRISTEIFGHSEFAVRLPALVCNSLSLVFSYLIVSKYFDIKKAFYFVFSLAFLPIMTVYSFIMTPDPPLIFFWLASLYFLFEYFTEKSYKNALLTGIFIGLGLLTKQTMFLFLFIVVFYFFFFNKNLFLKKETFFIYLIPFFIYLPNFYWNYRNQLVLFKHTQEHFSVKTFSFLFFVQFLIGSILVYTPLFLIFIYLGFKFIKNWRNSSSMLKFLYILSFPITLLLLILAYFIRLNINWIMPIVITGVVFSFSYIELSKKWRILIFLNLGIALIFSLLIGIFGYYPDKFPKSVQLILKHFKGWKELAQIVEKYSDLNLPILAENRAIASELAFYMKKHPKIYVISLKGFPENQYHLWRKDDDLIGKKIIMVKKGETIPSYLVDSKFLEKIVIKINKDKEIVYTIWTGEFRKL